MINAIPINIVNLSPDKTHTLPSAAHDFVDSFCGTILADLRLKDVLPKSLRRIHSYVSLTADVFFVLNERPAEYREIYYADIIELSRLWELPELKTIVADIKAYGEPFCDAREKEIDFPDADFLYEVQCARTQWAFRSLIFNEDTLPEFIAQQPENTQNALLKMTAFKGFRISLKADPEKRFLDLERLFTKLRAAADHVPIAGLGKLEVQFHDLKQQDAKEARDRADIEAGFDALVAELSALELPIREMMTYWPIDRNRSQSQDTCFEDIYSVLCDYDIMQRYSKSEIIFSAELLNSAMVYGIPREELNNELQKMTAEYLPWKMPSQKEGAVSKEFFEALDDGNAPEKSVGLLQSLGAFFRRK